MIPEPYYIRDVQPALWRAASRNILGESDSWHVSWAQPITGYYTGDKGEQKLQTSIRLKVDEVDSQAKHNAELQDRQDVFSSQLKLKPDAERAAS